jgi:transcriptional regulator with XRE-family HTH domain
MTKSVHSPEYSALRAALSEARTKAGLSQRQLAARLHVPHSWVAKVENGERRIDLVEFGWFVSACGADPRRVASRVFDVVRARRKPDNGVGGQRP